MLRVTRRAGQLRKAAQEATIWSFWSKPSAKLLTAPIPYWRKTKLNPGNVKFLDQSGFVPDRDLDNWLETGACLCVYIPKEHSHIQGHRHLTRAKAL